MIYPTKSELQEALSAASSAHHEFQQNYLSGIKDEYWAEWYSAYVLGRLGEFTTPSLLTKWLEGAQNQGDWDEAADYIIGRLSNI